MGLVIDKPSEEFYKILKALQKSISDTLLLRNRFDPYTELAGETKVRYTLRRAMIESVSHGCHHFVSEGELVKVQFPVTEPGRGPTSGIKGSGLFEGWRKEI